MNSSHRNVPGYQPAQEANALISRLNADLIAAKNEPAKILNSLDHSDFLQTGTWLVRMLASLTGNQSLNEMSKIVSRVYQVAHGRAVDVSSEQFYLELFQICAKVFDMPELHKLDTLLSQFVDCLHQIKLGQRSYYFRLFKLTLSGMNEAINHEMLHALNTGLDVLERASQKISMLHNEAEMIGLSVEYLLQAMSLTTLGAQVNDFFELQQTLKVNLNQARQAYFQKKSQAIVIAPLILAIKKVYHYLKVRAPNDEQLQRAIESAFQLPDDFALVGYQGYRPYLNVLINLEDHSADQRMHRMALSGLELFEKIDRARAAEESFGIDLIAAWLIEVLDIFKLERYQLGVELYQLIWQGMQFYRSNYDLEKLESMKNVLKQMGKRRNMPLLSTVAEAHDVVKVFFKSEGNIRKKLKALREVHQKEQYQTDLKIWVMALVVVDAVDTSKKFFVQDFDPGTLIGFAADLLIHTGIGIDHANIILSGVYAKRLSIAVSDIVGNTQALGVLERYAGPVQKAIEEAKTDIRVLVRAELTDKKTLEHRLYLALDIASTALTVGEYGQKIVKIAQFISGDRAVEACEKISGLLMGNDNGVSKKLSKAVSAFKLGDTGSLVDFAQDISSNASSFASMSQGGSSILSNAVSGIQSAFTQITPVGAIAGVFGCLNLVATVYYGHKIRGDLAQLGEKLEDVVQNQQQMQQQLEELQSGMKQMHQALHEDIQTLDAKVVQGFSAIEQQLTQGFNFLSQQLTDQFDQLLQANRRLQTMLQENHREALDYLAKIHFEIYRVQMDIPLHAMMQSETLILTMMQAGVMPNIDELRDPTNRLKTYITDMGACNPSLNGARYYDPIEPHMNELLLQKKEIFYMLGFLQRYADSLIGRDPITNKKLPNILLWSRLSVTLVRWVYWIDSRNPELFASHIWNNPDNLLNIIAVGVDALAWIAEIRNQLVFDALFDRLIEANVPANQRALFVYGKLVGLPIEQRSLAYENCSVLQENRLAVLKTSVHNLLSVKSHLIQSETEQVITICLYNLCLVAKKLYPTQFQSVQALFPVASKIHSLALTSLFEQVSYLAKIEPKIEALSNTAEYTTDLIANVMKPQSTQPLLPLLRSDSAEIFAEANLAFHRGLVSGDMDGAIALYQRCLDMTPNYAVLYYCLGKAQTAKGDLLRAVQSYHTALQLDSKYFEAQFELAEVYYLQSRYAEALHLFQALEDQSVDARARLGKIRVLIACGQFEIVIQLCQKNMTDDLSRVLEAYAHAKIFKRTIAETILEEISERNTCDMQINFWRAQTYYELARYADAISICQLEPAAAWAIQLNRLANYKLAVSQDERRRLTSDYDIEFYTTGRSQACIFLARAMAQLLLKTQKNSTCISYQTIESDLARALEKHEAMSSSLTNSQYRCALFLRAYAHYQQDQHEKVRQELSALIAQLDNVQDETSHTIRLLARLYSNFDSINNETLYQEKLVWAQLTAVFPSSSVSLHSDIQDTVCDAWIKGHGIIVFLNSLIVSKRHLLLSNVLRMVDYEQNTILHYLIKTAKHKMFEAIVGLISEVPGFYSETIRTIDKHKNAEGKTVREYLFDFIVEPLLRLRYLIALEALSFENEVIYVSASPPLDAIEVSETAHLTTPLWK